MDEIEQLLEQIFDEVTYRVSDDGEWTSIRCSTIDEVYDLIRKLTEPVIFSTEDILKAAKAIHDEDYGEGAFDDLPAHQKMQNCNRAEFIIETAIANRAKRSKE